MTFTLEEELVNKYDTEEIVAWAEAQLKAMRQIALSKEQDKSFLLGRISSGLGDVANVLEALRKKINPISENEPPVVA